MNPPLLFSEEFDWPAKITYALSVLKEATAEEISELITELEGDAAQERIVDVSITIQQYLEAMQKEGKIKYSITLPHNVHTYKLAK